MHNERGTRTPSMEVDALSKRGKTVSKGKDIVRCPICSRFGHSSCVVFSTMENAKANVERCRFANVERYSSVRRERKLHERLLQVRSKPICSRLPRVRRRR